MTSSFKEEMMKGALVQQDDQAYSQMVDGIKTNEDDGQIADDAAIDAVHHHHQPDSHTRSLVKGLTWRVTATATTTVIAFFITGELGAALQIGLFEFLAKLFLYYLHERLWTRIRL